MTPFILRTKKLPRFLREILLLPGWYNLLRWSLDHPGGHRSGTPRRWQPPHRAGTGPSCRKSSHKFKNDTSRSVAGFFLFVDVASRKSGQNQYRAFFEHHRQESFPVLLTWAKSTRTFPLEYLFWSIIFKKPPRFAGSRPVEVRFKFWLKLWVESSSSPPALCLLGLFQGWVPSSRCPGDRSWRYARDPWLTTQFSRYRIIYIFHFCICLI